MNRTSILVMSTPSQLTDFLFLYNDKIEEHNLATLVNDLFSFVIEVMSSNNVDYESIIAKRIEGIVDEIRFIKTKDNLLYLYNLYLSIMVPFIHFIFINDLMNSYLDTVRINNSIITIMVYDNNNAIRNKNV